MSVKLYSKTPYHWDDREQAAADFIYIQKTKEKIMDSLCKELNILHNINFSKKAWDIILGYWVAQFLTVTLDRWKLISGSKKFFFETNFENLNTIFVKVPQNSIEAVDFFFEDEWNEFFFESLIHEKKKIRKRKFISYKNVEINQSTKKVNLKNNYFEKVRIFIKWMLNKFLNLFSRGNDRYVFSSTGLKTFSLLKLRYHLSGVFYVEPNFPLAKGFQYQNKKRQWHLPTTVDDTDYERLIKKLIPIWMPISFIEGFQKIRLNLKHIKHVIPSKVVIFSSYNHFSNDTFKIWAAEKINSGSRLVCSQHGGGPFHRYNNGQKFELDIADFFLATGGGNIGHPKLKDIGQLFSKFKPNKWNENGKAILVTVNMPRYVFDMRSMALANQMLSYFEDQFRFYGHLNNKISDDCVVRLYSNKEKNDYGWKVKERWTERFPRVKIEEQISPLHLSARKSRIFISTYNATTYNESLAANIPSVIFWDPRYWECAEYAKKDFEELKSVGIFHDSPESAASHVNLIWDNVADWWYSPSVQEARNCFCRKYARRDSGLEKRLATALKEASNEIRHNDASLKTSE